MLDMPAYANRLGAMIMALNEGVPDRASTPRDSWGRYCCGHCGRAVSPEREEYSVCPGCNGCHGVKHIEGDMPTGVSFMGTDETEYVDEYVCRNCGEPDTEDWPQRYGSYCDPDQGGCGHVGPAIDGERDE